MEPNRLQYKDFLIYGNGKPFLRVYAQTSTEAINLAADEYSLTVGELANVKGLLSASIADR